MGIFRAMGGAWLLRRFPAVGMAALVYGFFKKNQEEKRRRAALRRGPKNYR